MSSNQTGPSPTSPTKKYKLKSPSNFPLSTETEDLLKDYNDYKQLEEERARKRGDRGRNSYLSDKDDDDTDMPKIIFDPQEALKEFERRLQESKNACT